jgi:hypothetical protein
MSGEGSVIFCAADRMLTASGGIQYEPENAKKLRAIGDKIIVMHAGSVNVHAELGLAFAAEITNDGGIARRTIETYARLYADLWQKRFERIQEREVLGRRSMTMASYLANHATMNGDVVRAIDQDLTNFQLPEDQIVEAIFAGKDVTGSHIFVVREGHISCHDTAGYAVIGSGSEVAASQFIFAKHSPLTIAPKAVYTLHRAKRMAEQATGVGRKSDWYVIVTTGDMLHSDLLKLLEELYEEDKKREEESFERAEQQIKKDIAKRAVISQPSSAPPPPSAQSEPVSSGSEQLPAPSRQPTPHDAPAQPQPGSSRAGLRPRRPRQLGRRQRSG